MHKIVIIDDVDDNRDFLYFVLSERYDVARFANGHEALQHMRTDPPHLILLDISLPDITGFDVLAQMRQDPVLRKISVIAVTAHAMVGDKEKCLTAGFDDYVSKPILDLPGFLDRIDRQITNISPQA